MPVPVNRRALLAGVSLCLYAAVFTADVLWEQSGLGIGHFFYVAIALLALTAGPGTGAAGGLLAALLYATAIVVNPKVNSHDALSAATAIRAVTFVSMGALLGWYARTNRRLVAELEVLAQRDVLTGLPNTRAFEAAINRRLEAGKEPFALLLGDMDALMRLNHDHGHERGDDELRALADRLRDVLAEPDEIARVGGDEFAILSSAHSSDDAAHLALRLERLVSGEISITFGWASYPQDGQNALALVRAADERLYARKFVRGRRLGEAPLKVAGPLPRTG